MKTVSFTPNFLSALYESSRVSSVWWVRHVVNPGLTLEEIAEGESPTPEANDYHVTIHKRSHLAATYQLRFGLGHPTIKIQQVICS